MDPEYKQIKQPVKRIDKEGLEIEIGYNTRSQIISQLQSNN